VIGVSTFGESAPAGDLYRHFGITAERIAQEARRLLGRATPQDTPDHTVELAAAQ
jgi:transketolase